MAEKIIVAEDTAALRDNLVELLENQGYEVVGVGDGVAAEQAVQEGGAKLLILDLLLPKKQGLAVAESLRNEGNEIPIIMITGVLKTPTQAKEAKDRFGVKDYLLKPLEAEPFMASVNAALGKAVASPTSGSNAVVTEPMPEQGKCTQVPAALLCFRAQAERLSGVLDLVDGKQRARLFFYRGALCMAQSNAEGKHVAAELVRLGQLSPGGMAEAIRAVGEESAGLFKVLLGHGLAEEPALKEAYKSLAPRILSDCVAMGGLFRWTATDGFARLIPVTSVPVLPVLFDALKATPAPVAEKLLESRKQHRVSRGPNFDRFNPAIENNFGAEVSRAVNGRSRLGQIVAAAPNAEARAARLVQMYALLCTQSALTEEAGPVTAASPSAPAMPAAAAPPPSMPTAVPAPAHSGGVAVVQPAQRAAMSAGPAPAAPQFAQPRPATTPAPAPRAPPQAAPAAAAPVNLPPEVVEVVRDAYQRYALIADQSHYEVLGVPQDADPGTIKKTFFALAGRFHADKFAGLDLGPYKTHVDGLFARINEANDVLSKPERRKDYDFELAAKASGAQTDINAIFEAESNFTKAEVVLQRGDVGSAKRLLDRALELDPKDLYRAYHAYATWCVTGRPKTQAGALIKELEGYAANAAIPRVNEFLGHAAKVGEYWSQAKVYWKRVMEERGGNRSLAQRELANIQKMETDAARAKDGGMLGKLFKS